MILAQMAQTTLFTREQIDSRVAEMGRQISADFAGSELIALCVLKGAVASGRALAPIPAPLNPAYARLPGCAAAAW